MDAWTIPFNGVNYVCWKSGNTVKNRPLTRDEENKYFRSDDKEACLNAILNK